MEESEKHVEESAQELQKLNNYIKLLIESNDDLYLLLDREMRVVYCCNNIIRLLALKDSSEIIGKTINKILEAHPDKNYAKRSLLRFLRVKSGENLIVDDDVINWPSMGERSYHLILKRMQDSAGQFEGIVLTMHDDTALRLEEAERRINDILFSTQIPCMVWDEAGTVIAYNSEAARIFGYSDDLSNGSFHDFFLAIQPKYQSTGQETEVLKQAVIHEALHKGFSQTDVQLNKNDGTSIHFEISMARISWLSAYRLVVYYHDLTSIKAAESEAREAEERMRLMLDSTPLICVLRDDKDNIIDCNKEALRVFGVTEKADFIKNFYNHYPKFQPDGSKSYEMVEEMHQKLKDKDTVTFERTLQTINGELLPVESKLVRVKWKNSFRYMSYSRDLREVKANEKRIQESLERERKLELQKEAAQAASEAKSQFLAHVSHEIRTPMNAILGMSELLLSSNLNEQQHRYAEDVKLSAMGLLNIINDILDLSKIETGKFTLVPVHYDFSLLIENINSMAKFLTKKKDISFELVVYGEIPRCLYGDDIRLRQVLINLLSNAIKFTDEGYVRLSVEITDTRAKFSVSDTGIGIRMEEIPALFDAFTQTDLQRNRKKQGTGLGLSISKSLVEMMDGILTVESVYGKGSIFRVIFPIVLGDESLISYAGGSEYSICAPNAKILVVDDNTINLNVACGLLQLCKISADTASSGAQAIVMVRRNQYDMVFMDHMMPEMDGVDATRVIREMGIDVPIVALTANVVEGSKEMYLAAGMNDLLMKPINKEMLYKTLSNWIPAEKIEKAPGNTVVSEEAKTDELNEFWQKIGKMEMLSVKTGLERVSGQRDVYERSLELTIKEIEKCKKNSNKFLAAGDMHNFSIEVHGMKGSLANIGAMELSAIAKELEAASDRADSAFCLSNTPPFLQELDNLKSGLEEAFELQNLNKGPLEIPKELPPILARMTTAFEETDYLAINEEINSLDALKPEGALKTEIERIKDAILVMDYEGALGVMQGLLK
jgi:PAS domain S-box-containing protein